MEFNHWKGIISEMFLAGVQGKSCSYAVSFKIGERIVKSFTATILQINQVFGNLLKTFLVLTFLGFLASCHYPSCPQARAASLSVLQRLASFYNGILIPYPSATWFTTALEEQSIKEYEQCASEPGDAMRMQSPFAGTTLLTPPPKKNTVLGSHLSFHYQAAPYHIYIICKLAPNGLRKEVTVVRKQIL